MLPNEIKKDINLINEEKRVSVLPEVEEFINHRYHEAINNVTPSDRYLGLERKILKQRKRTKAETMRLRRRLYQSLSLKSLIESLN